MIGWLSASTVTINHLNHVLDESEPQYQTVEMVRKKINKSVRRGRKLKHRKPSAPTYHLYYAPGMMGKSEFGITVDYDQYHATPVGSIRTLEIRQGAFDAPYGRLQ